jgi:hypothetical protein
MGRTRHTESAEHCRCEGFSFERIHVLGYSFGEDESDHFPYFLPYFLARGYNT